MVSEVIGIPQDFIAVSRMVLILVCVSLSGWSDLKYRRVMAWTWYPFFLGGICLLVLDILNGLTVIERAVFLFNFSTGGFLILFIQVFPLPTSFEEFEKRVLLSEGGFMGLADTKAIATICICLPYIRLSHTILPAIPLVVMFAGLSCMAYLLPIQWNRSNSNSLSMLTLPLTVYETTVSQLNLHSEWIILEDKLENLSTPLSACDIRANPSNYAIEETVVLVNKKIPFVTCLGFGTASVVIISVFL